MANTTTPPTTTLIITHGMGDHTADSFKKEFEDVINEAYSLYPSCKNRKINDAVEIVSVDYNKVFEKHRKKMVSSGKDFASVLSGIPNQTAISEIVLKLVNITSKINDDKFFYTHWLDVLFYRFTMLCMLCRIELGKAIAAAVEKRNGGNVHVLGHSLGTAIVHDTLAMMYDKNFNLGTPNTALSPDIHRLASVHQVANVSRILETFSHVGKGVVTPNPGCVHKFVEYRHRADPFTIPKPFDPDEIPPWSHRYRLVNLKRVANVNTHSITHYFMNPMAHRRLLYSIDTQFNPSDVEMDKADEAFTMQTLLGKYQAVANKAEEIRLTSPETFEEWVESVESLRTFIRSFGDDPFS